MKAGEETTENANIMSLPVLFLSLIVVCSTGSSPVTATLSCDEYSVEEGTDPGTNSVKIVRGGQVLHTIKLLTVAERNGFAFDGVKKTKQGFEMAVEYGSRFFYRKNFIFICRHNKFYLSKIGIDSFDKQNPEKWSRKVIRVRPNVPLEKFSITDFMLEGVFKGRSRRHPKPIVPIERRGN